MGGAKAIEGSGSASSRGELDRPRLDVELRQRLFEPEHRRASRVRLTTAQRQILESFPPEEGWTTDRYGEIVLGQREGIDPTPDEEQFLEAFPRWSQAAALQEVEAEKRSGVLLKLYKFLRNVLGTPIIVLGLICLSISFSLYRRAKRNR